MGYLKTDDKRFLSAEFRAGYSDYKRFGESGSDSGRTPDYYDGFGAAAAEAWDFRDEYLENHSTH